jgi:hypothetical protein
MVLVKPPEASREWHCEVAVSGGGVARLAEEVRHPHTEVRRRLRIVDAPRFSPAPEGLVRRLPLGRAAADRG